MCVRPDKMRKCNVGTVFEVEQSAATQKTLNMLDE